MKNMSGGNPIHRSFRPEHLRTWIHSPALRFGLCWYRFGLSDLDFTMEPPVPKERLDTRIAFGLCWYRFGLSDLDFTMEPPVPKERLDTSIARQGYDHRHTAFQGLKDRWISALKVRPHTSTFPISNCVAAGVTIWLPCFPNVPF